MRWTRRCMCTSRRKRPECAGSRFTAVSRASRSTTQEPGPAPRKVERMGKPLSLQLEELFFPVQEVRANPEHDTQCDRTGTNLRQSFNLQAVEGQAGLYGVELLKIGR